MRVCLLAFDSEELTIRLASELAKTAQVQLILPERGSEPFLKWLDPRVEFHPFAKPRLRQPLRQIRVIRKVIQMVKEGRPDVLHFQKRHLWFFLFLPILKRIPLVISIHDPKPHAGDAKAELSPLWMIWRGYRRADRVIVHNDEMKAVVVADIGYPADQVEVIPLIERGDRTLAPDVVEAGGEILFFGRIWPYKGLEYLIRAAEDVFDAVPGSRIVVAGQGEDFDRYRAMITKPERFEILNRFIDEIEVAQLFRRASVVVLPYLEATQSAVIPTAYTFAKPVVATSVGGLPSQVDHSETGLLVPPGDSSALAAAIVTLLRDPEGARIMGRQGQAKLDREWSAEAVASKTLAVYESLLDGG